jgi:hypothetical protein
MWDPLPILSWFTLLPSSSSSLPPCLTWIPEHCPPLPGSSQQGQLDLHQEDCTTTLPVRNAAFKQPTAG